MSVCREFGLSLAELDSMQMWKYKALLESMQEHPASNGRKPGTVPVMS